MESDLTPLFNALASLKDALVPVWSLFKNSIFYDVSKLALVGVGGYGVRWGQEWWKDRKEEQAIRDEDFTSHEASITQIAYLDTSQRIEGKEVNYFLQYQHRLGHVEIEAPFSKKIQNKIAKYLDLAMEKCTAEEPVVFGYLKEVVAEEDYPQVRDAIRNYWRYYFSSEMAKASEFPLFSDLKLKSGYEPEKEPYVPVLVYNPESTMKELRILWLTEDQVKNAPRIKKDQILPESPNSLEIDTEPELDSVDLEWFDLYDATLSQLRGNPDIVDLSRVGILTGEKKKIKKLKFEPKVV